MALAPAGQIKYSRPPLPTLDGEARHGELTDRQHVIAVALFDLQNLIAEGEDVGSQGVVDTSDEAGHALTTRNAGSYDDHAWTSWAIGLAAEAWETSMTVRAGNLFVDVSAGSSGEEAFTEIFARPGLKIERIISQGQASFDLPPRYGRLGRALLA